MSEIAESVARADIEALVEGRHRDPFAVLGYHPLAEGGGRLTAFVPGAADITAFAAGDGTSLGALARLHPVGLFSGTVPGSDYRLKIDWPSGLSSVEDDPYRFGPLLGELDLHLLAEGRHRELGQCLGAQPMTIDRIAGTRFAVWAPNALRVSVVGDFNHWDGRRHPMRLRHAAGVWELFLPGIGPGARYKFELLDRQGRLLPQKADPVARATEVPPATASVVAAAACYPFTDEGWMASRGQDRSGRRPLLIYEVHAGSWLRAANDPERGWSILGDRLIPYAVDLGFTHIELLPIMEHPFGGSWGYQPLAQFAPSARFGAPASFAAFVNRCHEQGLGVILDWVPGHFPTDAYGLARFDGTALYEYLDPREGFHRDWNTYIYNLGRNEVRGFLIASALFWLEAFHIDGLRVDAVASMLYRDYSRKPGEWLPNRHGGRENLEAIDFLRELNSVVAERVPGALTIAEESTAWPGVTAAVADGGLGFCFKWNMGWMHDTLRYIEHEPIHRRWHHNDLTFGMMYAFSERFVLPISHDEVVYGKGSLLGKMPGDDWQRFANLRAYLSFMWTHPGKKLLFMGCEIAQPDEWDHDGEIEWGLTGAPRHAGVQRLVRDLNALVRSHPALYAEDGQASGFRWIVGDDAAQSVLVFVRRAARADGTDETLLVALNFTPVPRLDYRIGVPHGGRWREIFNSDAELYGGSNLGNAGLLVASDQPAHAFTHSVDAVLPPLAGVIFAYEPT